jgi:hypothetical protein
LGLVVGERKFIFSRSVKFLLARITLYNFALMSSIFA